MAKTSFPDDENNEDETTSTFRVSNDDDIPHYTTARDEKIPEYEPIPEYEAIPKYEDAPPYTPEEPLPPRRHTEQPRRSPREDASRRLYELLGVKRTPSRAVTSLLASIGGFFLGACLCWFPPIGGVIQLVGGGIGVALGIKARMEIRRSPEELAGEGLATGGIITGVVTVFSGILLTTLQVIALDGIF